MLRLGAVTKPPGQGRSAERATTVPSSIATCARPPFASAVAARRSPPARSALAASPRLLAARPASLELHPRAVALRFRCARRRRRRQAMTATWTGTSVRAAATASRRVAVWTKGRTPQPGIATEPQEARGTQATRQTGGRSSAATRLAPKANFASTRPVAADLPVAFLPATEAAVQPAGGTRRPVLFHLLVMAATRRRARIRRRIAQTSQPRALRHLQRRGTAAVPGLSALKGIACRSRDAI